MTIRENRVRWEWALSGAQPVRRGFFPAPGEAPATIAARSLAAHLGVIDVTLWPNDRYTYRASWYDEKYAVFREEILTLTPPHQPHDVSDDDY